MIIIHNAMRRRRGNKNNPVLEMEREKEKDFETQR